MIGLLFLFLSSTDSCDLHNRHVQVLAAGEPSARWYQDRTGTVYTRLYTPSVQAGGVVENQRDVFHDSAMGGLGCSYDKDNIPLSGNYIKSYVS